ncbi:MAG: hypothetical protein HY807_12090 [Nitrospirae bacterium]|nr:hypothetical protein [Nitrospirota bacterium]
MDPISLSKIRRAVFFIIALLVLSLFCINNVPALSSSRITVTSAFDGLYIKGKGLPLKIVIENAEDKAVEGDIKITGGLMEYDITVRLEPYSTYEKWILAHPAAGSGLMLQFTAHDGFTFKKDIKTSQFISRKRLALHISKERGKLPSLNSAFNNEDTFSQVTPAELWDIWKGYESADYVLLDADAVEFMTAAQLTALKGYALSGGSLYIGESIYPEIYKQDFFQEILPYVMPQNGLRISHAGQNRAMHIPAESPSEEVKSLFLNVVKWNTGHLVLLALAGFAWNKRYRRFILPLICILVVTASLASMGMLNGKNRLRGNSVINISNGEDAFLQSRMSLISVRNTAMSAEFQGGFIYPADIDANAVKTGVYENGLIKKITADLMMFGHKDIIWERFEKLKTPLNADLKVYAEGIQGKIENLSDYRLKEAFIYINERFFSLPSIEAGSTISVDIIVEKDKYLPYPEGRQWISRYILNNEEGAASQGMKIVGLWERPLLQSNDSGLLVEKEETFLLYHL